MSLYCLKRHHQVSSSRGGGNLVLFMVRGRAFMVRGRAIFWGTFFKPLRNYGYLFYGCPFQDIFQIFRNYGPDFHSIYGIMTLKSTRTYGIMGTNFSGKMARPRQMIGRDTP